MSGRTSSMLSPTMYSDILVPTDGSEASTVAVDHRVTITKPHTAAVHFLHVIDAGTEMSASGVIAPDLTETLEEEAENALDAAAARAREAGVSYERTVLEGIPHEAIAEYSTDHDIDLIVMGASGRTGLQDRLPARGIFNSDSILSPGDLWVKINTIVSVISDYGHVSPSFEGQ